MPWDLVQCARVSIGLEPELPVSDPNLDQNYDIFVGTILAFNANVLHAPNRQPCPVRNSERSSSYAVFWSYLTTSLSNRNIVLAILLLAGDVHPNPGPINRETIYPCGYCQQYVGTRLVLFWSWL